ncbi:ATP-binding protein [Aeromonas jandaei]|uniref:ATP-binding protein n=1 Tax=Aeromonas jandaei TaxID=650 RepID=UPI001ABF4539|nr:transporter substrate-binding domain-containing protein [Aeromonas jandaei]QSR73773.1 transporter substrate-binding domain-containing protein [Aeromonas jandaei]
MPGFYLSMIKKSLLLLGAMLAMPLQAMMLPLDPATQAYLRSIKELKVCYPAALPPPYVTPDGGLLKDRLLRLADMLPVPLKLSEMADWQAARAALQRGACDIIPHIGTLGREETGLLVSRPMMETDAAILYRGDLRQATFLVSSATDTSAILRELHPGAELRTLRRGESIYSALEREKNSAYLGDYLQLRYLMREYPADGLRLRRLLGDERVVSYRLMMRNDPELAKFVDTLIRYMPAGTLYTDLSRYMDQGALYINRLHFNDAEQAWLSGRRRVVRLVMNPQLMPYSGINDQGEAKGWSADILNWVTQESGLKYILVPAATKAEAIEKLRNGEADMMAGLPESPEFADDFTFSRMISINRFALISKHAISADKFSQLGKQRILVPESLYDPSLLAQLGDQEWVRTDDLSQGITLLQQGKADAMLSELYQLQYPQRTHLLEGLQIKELDDRFGLGFAIRKDQTELAGVIDRNLMALTNTQIDELNQRWRRLVVMQQSGVSYSAWFGSIALALLISGIVIGVIWRSRQQLAREVAQRQAAEKALAIESELRETMFQALPVPVYLRNEQGRVIKSNKQGHRLSLRYGTELLLPEVQSQKSEGELSLGEQVFAYVQHPLRLEKQAPATDLIALSDISALRQQARILRQAERRLRALTNTVPGVVLQFLLVQENVGTIEFISRGCYELLGLASQQIRREPARVLDLLEREDLQLARSTMFAMLHEGKPFVCTLRYHHPEQGLRWLQLSGRGRSQPQGWRIYAVMQDVTARVEQEQALQLSHEEAQQAVQAKGRFLAAISHEIRTPMNAILGLLEWLASTPLSQEQGSALARIRQAGDELLGLLNDVLDFSRNENSTLSLSPQPTDFTELCEHVAAVHWTKARAKQLQLRLRLDPAMPALQILDPHRIQQVLHNLLSNAIKFSHRGEVVLWAESMGSILRFGVDDQGPGITDEMRPTLFMPFEQFAVAGQLRAPGTGLGLAICKQLIEQMGGIIDVEPRTGGGSRFFCELPLKLLKQVHHWQPKVRELALSLPPDEVKQLAPWLARFGVEVSGVANHRLQAQVDEKGFYYWEWQGEPWVPGTVINLLQPRLDVAEPSSATRPGLGMRVLLVEDHDVNRELIKLQLGQLGAEVLTAANGQLALDVLVDHEVDLVLTDLQMPVMNGADLCRMLRGSPRWRNLPAYVITADLSEQAAIELQSCGCNGHLDKPVALRELAAMLHQLGKKEGRIAEPAAASSLLSKELAQLYLDTTRADLAALEQCLANKDEQGVNAALHKLKGAARMVGATAIVTVIDEWQQSKHSELAVRLTRALDGVSQHLTKRAEDDHH